MTTRLSPDDDGYPRGLADLSPPPPILLRGDPLPDGPRVALVGSRRAAPEAAGFARRLARELSAAGAIVVSGGAYGIDAAAHEGALDAGAPTWAVLAADVDRPSPRGHRRLFARVLAGQGGLLAEADRENRRYELVRRNRLVAALADLVILVQGDPGSGTRHTLEFARALGRPVGAVPWSPWDRRGTVPRSALATGAFAVFEASEVAARLDLAPAPPTPAPALVRALGDAPRTLDELAHATGEPASALRSELGRLELRGWVRRRAGRYERT